MSDSMRPRRRQPTSGPRPRQPPTHPWDSSGKNTGVGCHFLFQCMKVKSESEVAQSCATLRDPLDCSLPGSSVHGIFQARVLEWGAIAFSENALYYLLKLSRACFHLPHLKNWRVTNQTTSPLRCADSSGVGTFPISQSFAGVQAVAYAIK